MTQPETGEPRNEDPGPGAPGRSRKGLLWASLATAVVLAAGLGIGLGLTAGGTGPPKAAGGTAAAHSGGSGAGTTTSTSVPATTTTGPSTSTSNPATRTAATPTTAAPAPNALLHDHATDDLKSGTYTGGTKNGGTSTPHYVVSLTKATPTSLKGSVQFVDQSGKTETAFTFSGQGGRRLAVLHPVPNATGPSAVTTGTLPHVIPALIGPGTIELDKCATYLKYASSTSDCTFTYTGGGHH
jgi:hypothetical protein